MQFVTEKEVEEIKVRRQKEWEKVRRPDQPLERPEEELDNRTLYEKLKSQRNKKQEDFEEQFKFKNMIYKGLDDEEAVFLQMVADKQAKVAAETRNMENEELLAYREAVGKLKEESESVKPLPPSPTKSDPSAPTSSSSLASSAPPPPVANAKPQKSQLSLIAGSIKTKRKRSSTAEEPEEGTSPEKKAKISKSEPSNSEKLPAVSTTASSSALTGLSAYSSDSEDSSPDD